MAKKKQTLDLPPHLADHLAEIWDEMVGKVSPHIGPAGMEALVFQVWLMRDAQERIKEDGTIVADESGNPTPHPSLRIERDASGEIRNWIQRFGAR